MVVERNSATGDRVERRQSIIAPCEQPVASLVTDHKDDVVERLIAGGRISRSIVLRSREATRENHHQARGCDQSQRLEAKSLTHVIVVVPVLLSRHRFRFSSVKEETADDKTNKSGHFVTLGR